MAYPKVVPIIKAGDRSSVRTTDKSHCAAIQSVTTHEL